MKENYRTPKIEEFIQGFEFEIAQDYRFGIIDLSENNKETSFEYKRFWSPMRVYWKHSPSERVIEKDEEGNTFDFSGEFVNFFKPFDEQSLIDQKLVRVKNQHNVK